MRFLGKVLFGGGEEGCEKRISGEWDVWNGELYIGCACGALTYFEMAEGGEEGV